MNKTKKNKKKGFIGSKKRLYTKRNGGSNKTNSQHKEENEKENEKENDKHLHNDSSQSPNNSTLSQKIEQNPTNNEKSIDEIKKEVQNEKKHDNLLEKSGKIAEGVALNAVEKVGDILGIDLEDPSLVENHKEEIKNITKNAAEIGAIMVESVEPFVKPLIDETIKESGVILSDSAEAGVKVLLNTAEEIPGAGVIIGSLRSIGNIGDAVVSSINAGTEVVTSAADTVNASVKNFDRLIKEKEGIVNRTKASIDEFTGGFKSRKKQIKKIKKTKKKIKKPLI